MDRANCIHYHRAKLQYEIPVFCPRQKKSRSLSKNSVIFFFQNFSNLSFFLSLHYKVLHIINLQDYSIYI
jgi:hypothetical protein